MDAWDALRARRNDGYQVAYLLGVGYPADRPLAPNRRPFDEVVHRGGW